MCVYVREGEERMEEACVACVVVFATCCHKISWELCVCVCVCVCVWARGLVPGGPILLGCCAIACQVEDMTPRGQ